MAVEIKLKRLHPKAILPARSTEGAVGFDVYVPMYDAGDPDWPERNHLMGHQRVVLSTGWGIEVPAGYEVQVRSRSGLAANSGVCVLNSPGTIDPDYRGELKIILCNTSDNWLPLAPGMRIAQIVVAPVLPAVMVEVASLSDTERGANGFGSTGQ